MRKRQNLLKVLYSLEIRKDCEPFQKKLKKYNQRVDDKAKENEPIRKKYLKSMK